MRIFLAGHHGMVGSAILRRLQALPQMQVVTASRQRLDLTDQRAVTDFITQTRPDAVIIAAARVGGIMANATQPADFLYDNLMIASNLIHAAHQAGVARLLQLGSSCIYPRDSPQPIPESALLTGALEPTNAPYALAKIAAIKLCEAYNRQHGRDYRSLMPTNLYGPGDNFHPDHAHVLPALMLRFHQAQATAARQVTIWGSGRPRREFLHVDDLADAALFVLTLPKPELDQVTRPDESHLNIGWGSDIAIIDLARQIAALTGFRGAILCDPARPDGTPRKLLDTSRMQALGWQPRISLQDGLRRTYDWVLNEQKAGKALRAR
jgi:GDP-L-fucose synthase